MNSLKGIYYDCKKLSRRAALKSTMSAKSALGDLIFSVFLKDKCGALFLIGVRVARWIVVERNSYNLHVPGFTELN